MVIQSCCARSRRRKCHNRIVAAAGEPHLLFLEQKRSAVSTSASQKSSSTFSTSASSSSGGSNRRNSVSSATSTSTSTSATTNSLSEWNDLNVLDLSQQFLGHVPDVLVENADHIEHLILDGNFFTETSLGEFPQLDNLKSLSLNSNKIKNIGVCLQLLLRKCPNLEFLSLIGNPGWPHPITNPNSKIYESYAKAAIKFLPKLRFIDTTTLRHSS